MSNSIDHPTLPTQPSPAALVAPTPTPLPLVTSVMAIAVPLLGRKGVGVCSLISYTLDTTTTAGGMGGQSTRHNCKAVYICRLNVYLFMSIP